MNQGGGGGVKLQYDESGSLEVANMTETANKSKRGEGDGRKMTFFFYKKWWIYKNLLKATGLIKILLG